MNRLPALSTREVLVARHGAVLVATLNRPEAMNALTAEMVGSLEAVADFADDMDDVRVLVLTGCGKAFCAGADLKAFDDAQAVSSGQPDFLELAARAIHRVRAVRKPVVAALNGVTMAGGLELAMAADVITAADTARIGDGHANFGVYPGAGGAAVLPRLIPLPSAMYLLFTGKTWSAAEMKSLGLVSEVHPAGVLLEATLGLAQHIALRSPAGLRRMKEVARAAAGKTLDDALLHEQVMLRQHLRSRDWVEGLRAFNEKRPPLFMDR